MKRNDGFTMVELLITIAAAAVVTLGAVSLLLLGVRMQRGATEEASEQQKVRIVMTLLEELAGSGEIKEVNNSFGGWSLEGSSGVLFEYVAAEQTLYSGAKVDGGTPLLSELNGAGAGKNEKGLLHFSFDTVRGGSYETTVYSRIAVAESFESADAILPDTNPPMDPTWEPEEATARLAFLNTLAGEYNGGKNSGEIQKRISGDPAVYYSEWYIGTENFGDAWNADTPWCACFLSWAAVKSGIVEKTSPLVFADVDKGVEAFRTAGAWQPAEEGNPSPGDYVFFDWSGNRNEPSHVGAVLHVTEDYVYTIEGNSGDRVVVRQYDKDAAVIMGYGVLPFGETP